MRKTQQELVKNIKKKRLFFFGWVLKQKKVRLLSAPQCVTTLNLTVSHKKQGNNLDS